jgi:hypothetical protein
VAADTPGLLKRRLASDLLASSPRAEHRTHLVPARDREICASIRIAKVCDITLMRQWRIDRYAGGLREERRLLSDAQDNSIEAHAIQRCISNSKVSPAQ